LVHRNEIYLFGEYVDPVNLMEWKKCPYRDEENLAQVEDS
jgi:hypothetical protein